MGLAGYYRRFIRKYGVISKPLIDLLKKHGFHWSPDATTAFEQLKVALTTALVLSLPSLDKQFVVEIDACDLGIGVVLMQEKHSIAYIRKALASRHLGLSVYEKEMIAIVYSVKKWHHYLCSRKFLIRTDHRSLKYMLEQWISTIQQQKYMAKLFGYDFEISYKAGSENVATDALSRVPMAELATMIVSSPNSSLIPKLETSWQADPTL